MDQRFRDRLAAVTGIVGLTLGLIALALGRVDFGMTFRIDGDRVLVDNVAEHSPARREGFEPGMVVLSINDVQLMWLPEYVEAAPGPDGEPSTEPPRIEPSHPTPAAIDPTSLARLVTSQIVRVVAIRAADLVSNTPESYSTFYVARDYGYDLRESAIPLFGGAFVLVVGAWWLSQGRGGESLRDLAVPLAVATALPLLVRPLEATWYGSAILVARVLVPFGLATLGLALAERIAEPEVRGVARMAAIGCAAGAMLLGTGRLWLPPSNASVDLVWGALCAGIALVPGLAAAGPLRSGTGQGGGTTGPVLLQSAELAVAGATPLMALATSANWLLVPLSAWIAGVIVAGRSTIRPLARMAVRAQLQRDLVVAATEAERARVAADIHDDALQDLTRLVRRLDETGDAEGAEIARTVSDRLRAICGDLRLPILDDLGVGPALDWLVLRIERLVGSEVRLERTDGTRPPPNVELAFFRVAQEALGNAVKHGKGPIVVRYHATDAGASLSVDDAGPGIAADAADRAEHDGRFGILNMRQRAEQIGAILDIRRWPSGGTHVALEWRPH